MGLEVENVAGDIHTTVTTSSTVSTSGPKTFMFGKKSGFVIPKNKLSGSLVPVFRATKKGDGDSANEEGPVQVQRKTKWGPDLMLDTTVRKGKALAYQARINQISEQLTLGSLAMNHIQDPLSTSDVNDGKTSDHQLTTQEMQLLELERREIIGELLKLNPSYKAPANYKPLLKEEKVPIPIRDNPGYNVIGLLFGPASDTLKRLEKETEAKIRVFGIKTDTGGKVEITPSDGKEIADAYEDMYVHVSADSFGKVDAAVALIELLVTPVSMNPASASSTSTAASNDHENAQLSQSTPSSIPAPALISQGTAQPYAGSFQPPHGQTPMYSQAWFPTQNNPNPNPVSSSPFNLSNMPSLFGPRPTSFSPIMQNPSLVHSRPLPPNTLSPQYMQPAPPLLSQNVGPRNSPPSSLTGPPHSVRPVMSTPQGLTNFISMSPQGPSPGQNMVSTVPPSLNAPNNMVSPVSGPSHSCMFLPLGHTQPAMSRMHAANPNVIPGPNSLSPIIPRPNSSDFTFQPHRPPYAAASQPSWQGNQPQPPHHNMTPPMRPSSMRPVMHNLELGPPINQPRPQFLTNFGGNPSGPPRHPFPSGPHMQPRNFVTGPFPPRQGNNQMLLQQNHPFGENQPPPMFSAPHQHFRNRPGSSGVQQVYDPFSPTSVPFNPQMGNNNAARVRNESDPEYEDLMASVGVK